MATSVVTRGIQGPAGPATVAVGSVITARGRLAVGNSVGTPVALAPGASGTYLRSDGTDPLYSAILAADLPTGIDAAKLADGTISNAELQRLDGISDNIVTLLAAKAASVHSHTTEGARGLVFDWDVATAAETDNTTSTVTYAVALTTTTVLPTGTWTLHAFGGLSCIHSAAGTVVMRASVTGQDSSTRTLAMSSSVYQPIFDFDNLAGLSGGTHTTYIHFRAGTAGTVTVRNPWLLLFAVRTA